ncbi:hypothetical protein JCGZ_19751 [Jatropha curcas]|uniref:Uncharacterized protein n=1 Tax=Jatropha curcas TaxID=180498 RepID=A0A067LJY4_JATCU|nr:hypothetical protein JCGZ_19751 [Jatropha curcas]
MTITPVDFAAIIGHPFRGQSLVFDDWMRTLDQTCLQASLRAAIGMESTISDKRVLLMPSLYGFDGDINVRTLLRGPAWRFNRRYAYTTSEVSVFRQLLNNLSWDRVCKELAWHLQLVEVGELSVAGVLVVELDVGQSLLKRLRSLAITTWRRRLQTCLELASNMS